MTPAAIRALPAAALPQVLYDAGLAPDGCLQTPDQHHGARPFRYSVGSAAWTPHRSWDHAMALLDRATAVGWRLSLTYAPARPDARRGSLELLRHPHHVGLHFTRTTGPEQVCRIVLLAYYAAWQPAQGDTDL